MGVLGTPTGTITSRTTGSLSLSYLGFGESATNSVTSTNFGNFIAPSAGLMIVLYYGREDNTVTVTSISIGGTAGTKVDLPTNIATDLCSFAYRQVSSGSQNVTVNFSGSTGTTTKQCCLVWFLTGNVSDTPYSYTFQRSASATTNTITHGAAPYSVTVYLASQGGAADQTISSWSGATVDEADNEIVTSGAHFGGAHYTNNTTNTVERSETVTISGVAIQTQLLAVSWI